MMAKIKINKSINGINVGYSYFSGFKFPLMSINLAEFKPTIPSSGWYGLKPGLTPVKRRSMARSITKTKQSLIGSWSIVRKIIPNRRINFITFQTIVPYDNGSKDSHVSWDKVNPNQNFLLNKAKVLKDAEPFLPIQI